MDIQPWQFLVITQIIIFLLGWPLEWTEILIIFVPIFLPLVEFFGVNPYFFAMLIALNLQTSFLTPPMAMSAYYLKGVQTKNVELLEIFGGIMPFLLIVIFLNVISSVILKRKKLKNIINLYLFQVSRKIRLKEIKPLLILSKRILILKVFLNVKEFGMQEVDLE